MITRPHKRIGGAIGLELDAIWEAMARLEVTGDDDLLVDRTSRGTKVRKRAEDAEVFAALFCVTVAPVFTGHSFKARRVISGYQFTGLSSSAQLVTEPEEEDIHFAACVSPMSGFGVIRPDSPYEFMLPGNAHPFCRRYNSSRAVGEIFVAVKILISTVPPENYINPGPSGPNIEFTTAIPTWVDVGFYTDFNAPTGALSNNAPIDPGTGCAITPGSPYATP